MAWLVLERPSRPEASCVVLTALLLWLIAPEICLVNFIDVVFVLVNVVIVIAIIMNGDTFKELSTRGRSWTRDTCWGSISTSDYFCIVFIWPPSSYIAIVFMVVIMKNLVKPAPSSSSQVFDACRANCSIVGLQQWLSIFKCLKF